MRDKTGGVAIEKCIALKSKMYSVLMNIKKKKA